MAYPPYIREKARQLRREKKLTIDELADRLALSRTTIYYWVRDLPIERKRERMRAAALAASRVTSRKHRLLREEAYRCGIDEFPALVLEPTFRDFVCMYIGEGYKRSRNKVALGNSDPAVVKLATCWIMRFAANPVRFEIQYHADQDLQKLVEFWSEYLDVTAEAIRHQRKSNSGQMNGRIWRSRYGVMSVVAGDTMLRARLQAWMDCVQEQWLDSSTRGVAQPGSASGLGPEGSRFESERPDSSP